MQGSFLFTLSCSDQSDECRSHSPFSPRAHGKLRFGDFPRYEEGEEGGG